MLHKLSKQVIKLDKIKTLLFDTLNFLKVKIKKFCIFQLLMKEITTDYSISLSNKISKVLFLIIMT